MKLHFVIHTGGVFRAEECHCDETPAKDIVYKLTWREWWQRRRSMRHHPAGKQRG